MRASSRFRKPLPLPLFLLFLCTLGLCFSLTLTALLFEEGTLFLLLSDAVLLLLTCVHHLQHGVIEGSRLCCSLLLPGGLVGFGVCMHMSMHLVEGVHRRRGGGSRRSKRRRCME